MGERRAVTFIASALVVGSSLIGTAARAEPRAVVELFTSQGCSSCPPADKLLGELSHDRSIVALSLSINYWDYLGWKDTLALPGHAARQRAYAAARGDRQVYTPQAIINGTVHVLGSDRSAIERAIEQTHKNAEVLSLPVSLTVADGRITVSAPAMPSAKKADVWLCPLSKEVKVPIGRGENSGHTITYHNVVRRWVKLGEWTGDAGTWSVPVKDVQSGNIESVAAVVQVSNAATPGVMLGAAIADLR
jgi:hypothetical protein